MDKVKIPDELLDAVSGGKIFIRTPDGVEHRVEDVMSDGNTGEIFLLYRIGKDFHKHMTGESGWLKEFKYAAEYLALNSYVVDYVAYKDKSY